MPEKMGYITLVTPPDFIKNNNRSYYLINLHTKDKDDFTNLLNLHFPNENITIYVWDDNEQEQSNNWSRGYKWKQQVYTTAATTIFKNEDQSFSVLNKNTIKNMEQLFNSK